MSVLREVDVGDCSRLAEDWLPDSSAASVLVIRVAHTRVRRLPSVLRNLQDVDVSRCKGLMVD